MFILITSFGFIVGILLIIFRDKFSKENIWLSLFILSNASYAVFSKALFEDSNKWIVKLFFPYFVTFNYSSGAFLLLYFIFKTKPERGFKFHDVLHFLIPIILFFNSTPFIFFKGEVRDALFSTLNASPTKLLNFPYLFFEYKYHLLGRPLLALISVLISIYLVINSYLNNKFKFISKIEMRYIVILLLSSLIHYYYSTTAILSLSNHPEDFLTANSYQSWILIPRISIAIMLISILFFPQIIFQKFFPNTLSEFQITKKSRLESANPSSAPQYDLANIDQVVKKYLGSKPFLRPGFSLFNFSEETKIPQHQLTYYLKVYHEQTFNDFKNNLRIQHAIELLESGVAKNHTLETISITCGFRSRTNFIDSFKKVTGKTPSDYLKS